MILTDKCKIHVNLLLARSSITTFALLTVSITLSVKDALTWKEMLLTMTLGQFLVLWSCPTVVIRFSSDTSKPSQPNGDVKL